MKTRLEELKEEIAKIEYMQRNCNHEWNEPVEEVKKIEVYDDQFIGVNTVRKLIGYRDVPCWTRICKKCEKKETTTEIGEIVVKTKKGPIFK